MAYDSTVPNENNLVRTASGDLVKMRQNFEVLDPVATSGLHGLISGGTPLSGSVPYLSASGTDQDWHYKRLDLDSLSGVDTSGAISGQPLTYDGSGWGPGSQIRLQGGSADSPSYGWSDANTKTGIFLKDNNEDMAISINGVQVMLITSAMVGIFDDSPGATLDVDGDFAAEGIRTHNGDASEPGYHFINNTSTGFRLHPNNDDIGIYVDGTQVIRVNSGQVGINDNTPSRALDVTGDVGATGQFLVTSGNAAAPGFSFIGAGDAGMYKDGPNIRFAVSGNALFRLSLGRALIHNSGGVSESTRLILASGGTAMWELARGENNNFSIEAKGFEDFGGSFPFLIDPKTPSPGLRIKDTSRVGIFESSPQETLDVAGSARVQGRVRVGSGTEALPSYSHHSDQDTGVRLPGDDTVEFVASGATRAFVSTSGLHMPSGDLIVTDTGTLVVSGDGAIFAPNLKQGTNQGNAGAVSGEIWVDTASGNVLKLGT